jgi:hypothetical protein
MVRKAGFGLALLALCATTLVSADEHEGERKTKGGGESTPYVVGTWKFVPNGTNSPDVDTEFRFINPTKLHLTLEYAFFDLAGNFCGCDRDDFPANKTTVYTVLGESLTAVTTPGSPVPFQFACTGKSGALKAIVFRNEGGRVRLGEAAQVGFQTHVFGNVMEVGTSPNFVFLQGAVMTEAGMKGITINDATEDEIESIHRQCVKVQGP